MAIQNPEARQVRPASNVAPADGVPVFVTPVGQGIGTDRPENPLHIQLSGNVIVMFESTGNAASQLRLKSELSANRVLVGLDELNVIQCQLRLQDDGVYVFLGEDTGEKRIAIGSSGELTIEAELIVPVLSGDPATPPSGYLAIYGKASGGSDRTFMKDDAGTVSEFALV